MLAALLTDFKDALMTGNSGTSRPAQLQAGGMWIDTTLQAAPNYQFIYKVWTGVVDIEVFRINVSSNFGGSLVSEDLFEVEAISADAVGAIQQLIKQRLLSNGQVLSGDTVGEIRMIGRTNGSTDPVVGYIKWVATDNQASGAYGGTLSFYSTPDASSTIVEHMRFLEGCVETTAIAKTPALILVTQNVATAATITQLSAAKVGVEFTGSTTTEVQGINADHESKEVVLHNRSTAVITLKHENGSAAADDRIKFPGGADYTLQPESSVTLFYCETDTRWKLKSTTGSSLTRVSENISGLINSWTAPEGVERVIVYGRSRGRGNPLNWGSFLDRFGNMYGWGFAPVGDATIIDKSSPVAIVGGLSFKRFATGELTVGNCAITQDGLGYVWGSEFNGEFATGTNTSTPTSPILMIGGIKWSAISHHTQGGQRYAFGIDINGKGYGWGYNNTTFPDGSSNLGVGVTTRSFSSPIAIVGGLKIEQFVIPDGISNQNFVLTSTGLAYAWGQMILGDLGVAPDGLGDCFSSPVAVLGGLTFKKLKSIRGGGLRTMGLTAAGALYAWGFNDNGQLGVGDVTRRSSPVAVIGGKVFKDFIFTQNSEGSFGLATDGTLYAWGLNSDGHLGLGDMIPRSSPVAVLGGIKFKRVITNGFSNSMYGLAADGVLYAWGVNTSGQLGLGDVVPRSSPVAVLGGLKFAEVCAGNGYVHAITQDGIAYGWGRNDGGYLGTGDRTDRSSPVAIVGPQGFDPCRTETMTSVPVVAGQTYDIRISQVGRCYFGNTPIGNELEEIDLEYEKRGN